MIGWLIYDEDSIKRNKTYAEMLISEAEKYKIRLKLINSNDIPYNKLPDFAISRSYNYKLSAYLENLKVRVFNSAQVSYICNDKYRTYEYFSARGIPMMNTARVISCDIVPYSYPFILKPTDGHGGEGVYMINNESEFRKKFILLKNRPIIAQKIASETGKDLRVYIMGNKILAGMMRTSDIDFRSNFSLGGKACIHTLNRSEISLIKNITDNMKFDYAGIDLIYSNQEPVLNEIEDVVGSRMLYSHTKINTAEKYIKYIFEELTKK